MKFSIVSALAALMTSDVTAKKSEPNLYKVDHIFERPIVGMTNENGDELIERSPKYEFEHKEMTRWIWGKDKYKTKKALLREEKMWEMDLVLQRLRGILQGWTRGFYKAYDYEIPAKCFSKETTMYLYYIEEKVNNFDFLTSYEILMLMYNVYFMFDYNCDVEEHGYDMANFCFNHDCDPEQLLKNEMSKVFQVTGSMNALAAIYYEDPPEEWQHLAWFDMYNEVGLSIGKISRYTMGYDPKADDIHEAGDEDNKQDWRDRD